MFSLLSLFGFPLRIFSDSDVTVLLSRLFQMLSTLSEEDIIFVILLVEPETLFLVILRWSPGDILELSLKSKKVLKGRSR